MCDVCVAPIAMGGGSGGSPNPESVGHVEIVETGKAPAIADFIGLL